jgi:hypothetical protein
MSHPLSSRDLLVLMEMCLDAEDRCEERYLAAREKGDFDAADRQQKLKERYNKLRYSVIGQMGQPQPVKMTIVPRMPTEIPAALPQRPVRSANG